jgi:Cof subfamily protein (haloacid dehalogenase superfamily)
MKIGMIVTDLDRSLLKNNKQLSEYTIRTLNSCHKIGLKIIFATARPIRSTKNYIDIIKPDGVIFHNGAIVMADSKILSKNEINPKTIKEIVKKVICDYPRSTISVEINDTMYTNFDSSEGFAYTKTNLMELPDYNADIIIIGTISVNEILSIKKYITENLYLEINDGIYGMIMNKNASKWNGIKQLSDFFRIEVKNTIAFGDDINDLEMIKNCGKGICVRNGLEEVKAVAKEICEDNENDGIAKWIKENIL